MGRQDNISILVVFSGAEPTPRDVGGPVVIHITVHKILNKVWEGNFPEISMIIIPNVKVRVWLKEFVFKG